MHGTILTAGFWLILLTVAIFCSAASESQAAPTAVINGSPPDFTNSTGATISITGEDVVGYTYRLDGGNYSAEIPVNVQIILAYLGDGFHTLSVLGKDSLGVWQATATTATWVVDTAAPDTTINAALPAKQSPENTGSFFFAATESGSSFVCAVDTAPYESCTSPYTFTALADGNHTFTVRATDRANNTDQSPARFEWTIDTTAPDTAIIDSPSNPSRESAGNFAFSSHETASFECSMDDGPFSECVSPHLTTPLVEGSHTFRVRAIDRAGNIDQSPASYSWAIDATPPLLSVSTLSDGSATSNEILNVTGSTDKVDVNLTVNGEPVPLNTDATFSHAVVLRAGTNIITTTATDPAGNQSSDRRTITLDQLAPTLDIATPSDNSVTAKPFVEVSGRVSEISDVEITVENSSGTTPAAQLASVPVEFSSIVNLAAGVNTIHISATDLLGNKSPTALKITVTLDNQKPSIAITDPSSDIRIATGLIVLKGTVNDAVSGVDITVATDDETFTPPVIDGAFEQEITFVEEKIYHITAKATDLAGNEAIALRNIIFSTQLATGDINNDRTVDVVDAIRALRISAGIVMQTDDDLIYGDIAPLISGRPAPDGIIDVGDAAIIMKIVTGLVIL